MPYSETEKKLSNSVSESLKAHKQPETNMNNALSEECQKKKTRKIKYLQAQVCFAHFQTLSKSLNSHRRRSDLELTSTFNTCAFTWHKNLLCSNLFAL